MRHRRKLVAGSAVAVALLAGGLFSGVLRGSPAAGSAAVDTSAGGLGERTLRDLPRRYRGHDRQARDRACAGSEQPGRPRSARSRLPDPLAGDRRLRLSASVRRGSAEGARRQPARSDRNARPREPGADPAPVPRRTRGRAPGARARSLRGAALRRRRGRPDRARAIPRRLRDVRADGLAQAEPRLVRPHLVCARAERRPGRRDLGDGARAGRRRRSARGDGLDAGRARQAGARPRPPRGCRATVPRRARDRPGLRLRARPDGAGRGCTGQAGAAVG